MTISVNALSTVAVLIDEMGLPDSSQASKVERMLNAASEAIVSLAGGRQFFYSPTIVEKVRGFHSRALLLSRTPIRSVAQIRLIDQAEEEILIYTDDLYSVRDAGAGIIHKESGWPSTNGKFIEVTYAGGWITPQQELDTASATDPGDRLVRDMPYDLEQACIITVISLWSRRSNDRQVESVNNENGPIYTYRPDGSIVPDEARALVDAYRRYEFI